MDIFLDDITSLVLLRTVARGKDGLALAPSPYMAPQPMSTGTVKLNSLGIPKLLWYLQVPESRMLGILVPSAQTRIRSYGINCAVRSRLRGETPFRELVSADVCEPSPLLSNVHVHVMDCVNVVLGMSGRLRERVRRGEMGEKQATLMLVKLCLELCGTYSHDPFDPHKGTVTYNTQPLTSAKELREGLSSVGNERGLNMARKAAELAYDRSGSPQESFMGPALFYETGCGGLMLGKLVPNKPLELSPSERMAIDYRTITPDFTLEGYESVVEYMGAEHAEGKNPQIDHIRALDYQTLSIRVFEFWYDDVRKQEDFMRSAARIVNVMEQYDGPAVRQRFLRLSRNKAFLANQKTLFKVFRPWER